MKNNIFLKAIFCGLLTFGVAAGSFLTHSSTSKTQENVLTTPHKMALNDETMPLNPDDYEEVSVLELKATASAYTSTPLSRSVKVQFDSLIASLYHSKYWNVFISIEDSRYSGKSSEVEPGTVLNGYTFRVKRIDQQLTEKDKIQQIVIPNYLWYATRFSVKNTRIKTGAMHDALDSKKTSDYEDITDIWIDDGIERIDSRAFTDVPSSVTFHCVAEEQPEDWAEDWCVPAEGAEVNILWGEQIPESLSEHVDPKISNGVVKADEEYFEENITAEDFMLGYKGSAASTKEGEDDPLDIPAYPLTFSYTKIAADGKTSTEFQELEVKHLTNPYDAVGSTIYGPTNSFSVVVDLEKDETVDINSFEFYNLFKVKRNYTKETYSWPEADIKEVFDANEITAEVSEYIPSYDGTNFKKQLFETSNNKYITVVSECEDDEAAHTMAEAYFEKFDISEGEEYEDGKFVDLSVIHDDGNGDIKKAQYPFAEYGHVLEAKVTGSSEKNPTFIRAQIYSYEDYFITYFYAYQTQEHEEEGESSYTPTNLVELNMKGHATIPFNFIPDVGLGGHIGFKCKVEAPSGDPIDISNFITATYDGSSSFLGHTSISMKVDKVLATAYTAQLTEKTESGNYDFAEKVRVLSKGEDGAYYQGTTRLDPNKENNDKVEGGYKLLGDSVQVPKGYLDSAIARINIENNIDALLTGDIIFRYTMSSLNNASYVLKYAKDGEVLKKSVKIVSPSPVLEISSDTNNSIAFIISHSDFEGISPDDIRMFGVSGATMNVHLYNKESNSIVQNTQLLNVFGTIEVYPESSEKLSFFNIDVYLILFFVITIVVYAALAVVLYFYKKNKYKNDEFRRMRTKPYVKSSIAGFIGLALILAAINFIVLRFSNFYSSVPVFNPIDAFVVIFAIAGAISLGFFIRFFVTSYKLAKKRRNDKRLHLDKDVVEDGTN